MTTTNVWVGKASATEDAWQGHITEVIAYNRMLTSEERERVECYLGRKYGVALAHVCASDALGCADGSREGLRDTAAFPDIAACDGAWSVGGVQVAAPACSRGAGDDGVNPSGQGCNIEDLCAEGWHVCRSEADTDVHLDSTCAAAATASGFPANAFYTTAQSGSGASACEATGASELFGCGTQGLPPGAGCGVLNAASAAGCAALVSGGWSCPATGMEALSVVKTGQGNGGALCCRN